MSAGVSRGIRKLISKTETLDRVVKVISDVLSVPESTLVAGTKIRQDLGADSMQIVTIMIALDAEFDAEFEIDELPTDDVTIDWICEFVQAAVVRTKN
jgi:acyl carrier protein